MAYLGGYFGEPFDGRAWYTDGPAGSPSIASGALSGGRATDGQLLRRDGRLFRNSGKLYRQVAAADPCCEDAPPPVGRSVFLIDFTHWRAQRVTRYTRQGPCGGSEDCWAWDIMDYSAAASTTKGPGVIQGPTGPDFGVASGLKWLAVETVATSEQRYRACANLTTNTGNIEVTDAGGVFHTWPLRQLKCVLHVTADGDRLRVWSTIAANGCCGGIMWIPCPFDGLNVPVFGYHCDPLPDPPGCFNTGLIVDHLHLDCDGFYNHNLPYYEPKTFDGSLVPWPQDQLRQLVVDASEWGVGFATLSAEYRTPNGAGAEQPATLLRLRQLIGQYVKLSAAVTLSIPDLDTMGGTSLSGNLPDVYRVWVYSQSAVYDPQFSQGAFKANATLLTKLQGVGVSSCEFSPGCGNSDGVETATLICQFQL